jgi:hypothetical protein
MPGDDDQKWQDRYYEERARRQDEALDYVRDTMEREFAHRDESLRLQAEANKVHFTALNNEAGRIAAAADKSVNREVYEEHREADQLWRESVRLAVDGILSRSTGRSDLVRWVLGGIAGVATVLAIYANAGGGN